MMMPSVRSRTRRQPPNMSVQTEAKPPARSTNMLVDKLDYAVIKVDPDDLTPPSRTLRHHSKRKVAKLEASLRMFGMRTPILAGATGEIICGHARWLAARAIGLSSVPVIYVTDLNPAEERLYRMADNRSAEESSWDESALKLELIELAELGTLKLDIDLSASFFDTCQIDQLILGTPPPDEEDTEVIEVPAAPVTRAGDLWQMGDHKLLCGDSLQEASCQELLGDERAQMIFSDVPYNLPTKAFSGLGKAQHSDFAMAAGEMSRCEFTSFLTSVFALQSAYSVDGSIHFQCIDWRHVGEMYAAGEAAYSELKNLIVFDKGSGGMGSFYRSQHELICAFKSGSAPHINNFGLGETGRYRTNVWAYRGNNSFHADRDTELAAHPTVKPRALVADAIRDCSHVGGIILDVFGGSGTTLVAAEITRRRARLIEIEPGYCDATIVRWQQLTGQQAMLVATGQTFDEIAAGRLDSHEEGA